MLIKANGAINSIMNKNVKTNKFRTKIMNKTNFQCCKKILLIKEKILLKKTNPIKVLFAYLQGKDMHCHSFTALLNSHILSDYFISAGISSQILGPRNLIPSVPLKTVRTGGMRNWDLCLKLQGISFLN